MLNNKNVLYCNVTHSIIAITTLTAAIAAATAYKRLCNPFAVQNTWIKMKSHIHVGAAMATLAS